MEHLAAVLQPRLKTSGPPPNVSYIHAAILVVVEGLSARKACCAAGIADGNPGRVVKLAHRLRDLDVASIMSADEQLHEVDLDDLAAVANDEVAKGVRKE